MKTLFKTALGLLLILAGVVVLTPLFLDPNDFKDQVSAQVARATGRELTLAGDLSLSLFPWIGIEVRDATLAQPPGFGDEPFASIAQAQVRARLLPLIQGRLELDEIRGRGLSLNLIRAADGRANWDDLTGAAPRTRYWPIPPPDPQSSAAPLPAPRTAPIPAPQQATRDVSSVLQQPASPGMVRDARPAGQPDDTAFPEPPASRRSSTDPMRTWSIGGILFDAVRISWEDRRNAAHLTLGGLSISTGSWARGEPLGIQVAGEVADRGTGFNAQLSANATLTFSPDGRMLTLDPFVLNLEQLRTPNGLAANGKLAGSLRGDLIERRFRSEALTLGLDIAGGPVTGLPIRLDARADLDLNMAAETFRLHDLTAESGDLSLLGDMSAAAFLSAPAYRGRLDLAELDLRAWLKRHGIPVLDTADPQTLSAVALKTEWQLSGERMNLALLELTLDHSKIEGTAAFLRGARPGYRFDLTADRLDLDAYLPTPARGASAGGGAGQGPPIPPPSLSDSDAIAPPGGVASVHAPDDVAAASRLGKVAPVSTAAAPESPPGIQPRPPATQTIHVSPSPAVNGIFPTRQIRALDLEGRIRAAELLAYGLTLGELDARITAKGGRLRVEERVGRFYGGVLEGHAELASDQTPPVLAVSQRAVGIAVGPLLLDLAGEDLITGSGGFEADLRTTGQSPEALKRGLAGRAAFHLAMGTIKGFNLDLFIRQAEARIKRRPPPPPEPLQTDFTELRASAEANNGVFVNEDLYATANYIQATGSGSVDIANERLDYRLVPKFVNPPEGRGIKEIEDIPIPIRITGAFARPDWTIELGQVLRDVARRELERESGGLLEELEERSGIRGLEKGLRNLFKF
jgi:AsmA protein